MAKSKDGVLRVNTVVRQDNEPVAKRLLRRRGAWSEFVNSKLAEEAKRALKRPSEAKELQ